MDNSVEDVERGWERLCRGVVGPEEGLVYESRCTMSVTTYWLFYVD